MTLDIKAARARCEAVTQGPWLVERYDTGLKVTAEDDTGNSPWHVCRMEEDIDGDATGRLHAEFIVNARVDLPEALDIIESLVKYVEVSEERGSEYLSTQAVKALLGLMDGDQ